MDERVDEHERLTIASIRRAIDRDRDPPKYERPFIVSPPSLVDLYREVAGPGVDVIESRYLPLTPKTE